MLCRQKPRAILQFKPLVRMDAPGRQHKQLHSAFYGRRTLCLAGKQGKLVVAVVRRLIAAVVAVAVTVCGTSWQRSLLTLLSISQNSTLNLSRVT